MKEHASSQLFKAFLGKIWAIKVCLFPCFVFCGDWTRVKGRIINRTLAPYGSGIKYYQFEELEEK